MDNADTAVMGSIFFDLSQQHQWISTSEVGQSPVDTQIPILVHEICEDLFSILKDNESNLNLNLQDPLVDLILRQDQFKECSIWIHPGYMWYPEEAYVTHPLIVPCKI